METVKMLVDFLDSKGANTEEEIQRAATIANQNGHHRVAELLIAMDGNRRTEQARKR